MLPVNMQTLKNVKKIKTYITENNVNISFLLLFILILSIFTLYSSSLLPLKITTTVEKGENGEPDFVSETAETSMLSIIIRTISIIIFLIIFYILIFILRHDYGFKNTLEFGWIFITPLFFLSFYMEYLFEKLPCPAHHNLELPMMFSLLIFGIGYFFLFIILALDILIVFGKSLWDKWRKPVTKN